MRRCWCCAPRLSDVEQRVRKKRRHRDFDDEDYEEPIQPRRVSLRKSAQVLYFMTRPLLSFPGCKPGPVNGAWQRPGCRLSVSLK